VIISDMTASQYGLLRSHFGTSMPPGGGYSINAPYHRPSGAHMAGYFNG